MVSLIRAQYITYLLTYLPYLLILVKLLLRDCVHAHRPCGRSCREYSSTLYFLFPVANFHFRLQFLQSIDELLELGALRFHALQPASLEIDLNMYM